MKSWVFYNRKQRTGEEKRLFLVDIFEGDIATFKTKEKAENKGYIRTIPNSTPSGLAKRIIEQSVLRIEHEDALTSIRAPIIIYGERYTEFPATAEQIEEFLIAYEKFSV